MTPQFQGGEFDWLRSQVQAVLWDPKAPRSCRVERIYGYGPVVQVASPPVAPPPYRQSSTVASSPPAREMTVSEYNEWRGRDQKAAALPYIHQEYPCLLYRTGESPRLVKNATEHKRLLASGWRDTP